jgi:hypothetical protein
MQQVTASDFNDWRTNPVTKAFYMAITDRIEDAKEVLATQAGLDLNEDNFLRGFIRAYREVLLFRIDDLQEAVDVD